MTEPTQHPPFEVDMPKFLLSLAFAPVIVGLLGFFMIFPLLAIPVGAPAYVLFGAPAFWLVLRRFGSDPRLHACTGFAAHILSLPFVHFPVFGWAASLRTTDTLLYVVLGGVHAALWGMTFAMLYRFRRR